MAEIDVLADWIIANQNLKGTPEFNTVAEALEELASRPTPSPQQAGFWSSFGEGAKTLGGLPAIGAHALQDTEETRQAALAAQQAETAKTRWEDVKDLPSFVDYLKQTAGASAGYLATPAALGKAAQVAAKSTPVGRAVGIGTLGLQYLTSNLGRQAAEQEAATQEGQAVRPMDVGRAALASAAQTGLDVAGFKFFKPVFNNFPFLKTLFGEAGEEAAKKATADVSEAIASGSFKIGNGIAQGAVKGALFEIPQEVMQQMAERWQAGLALNDEEARKEYKEALVGAAILGGGLGGVGGAINTAVDRARARGAEQAKIVAEEAKQMGQRPEEGAEVTAPPPSVETTTDQAKQARDQAEQAAAQTRSDEDLNKAYSALVAHGSGKDSFASVGSATAIESALGLKKGTGRLVIKDLESRGFIGEKKDGTRRLLKPFEVAAPVEAAAPEAPAVEPAAVPEAPVADPVEAAQAIISKPITELTEPAQIESATKALTEANNQLTQDVRKAVVSDESRALQLQEFQTKQVLPYLRQLESVAKKPAEPVAAPQPEAVVAPEPAAELRQTAEVVLERANRYKSRARPELVADLADIADKAEEGSISTEDIDFLDRVEEEIRSKEASPGLTDALVDTTKDLAENKHGVAIKEGQKEYRGMARLLNYLANKPAVEGENVAASPARLLSQALMKQVSEPSITEQRAGEIQTKEDWAAATRQEKVRGIGSFRPTMAVEGVAEPAKYKTAFEKLRKEGRVAAYYPKSNTFVFTKEGLTDETVMHELVHGYTVDVMHRYTQGGDQRASLTASQQEGAKQVVNIYNKAKQAFSFKYPSVFQNVHEFVAHAMTDTDLQKDLANAPFKAEPTKPGELREKFASLWDAFTNALAKMFLTPSMQAAPGNPLLELSKAVALTLSTPRQMKTEYTGAPLYAKKEAKAPPKRVRPPRMAAEDMTVEEVLNKPTRLDKAELEKAGAAGLVKYYKSFEGFETLIKRFQDSRRPLKLLQDLLIQSGRAVFTGDGVNTLYNLFSLSGSKADWAYRERLQIPFSVINDTAAEYARAMNIDFKTALNHLEKYLIARHEQERRKTLFQRFVPLENNKKFVLKQFPIMGAEARSAAAHREQILSLISKNKTLAPAEINQLRQAMDYLTDTKNGHIDKIGGTSELADTQLTPEMRGDPNSDIDSMDSNLYAPLGQYTSNTAKALEDYFKKQEQDPKLGPLLKSLSDGIAVVQEQTIAMSKAANYWTPQLDNVRAFYGWKHYVPFKGKPEYEASSLRNQFELFSEQTGGGYELVESQEGFKGRDSDTENVILQTMVDGSKAAMRMGRMDITQAIKNLIDKGYIAGKNLTPGNKAIAFEDRFKGTLPPEKEAVMRGPDKIYHYRPDGSIEVLQIYDRTPREKAMLSAIRRAYSEPHPITDIANRLTGAIGSFHTRYNPSFHVYNFIRDIFTNALIMGAQGRGWSGTADYVSTVAQRTADLMPLVYKISRMYHNNDIEGIKRLQSQNPSTADVIDYLRKGGRTAYISGFMTRPELDKLNVEIKQGSATAFKQGLDKWVDTWSDTFELTSRVAAYSVNKSYYMSEKGGGLSKEAAEARAVADAKNLANFETVGDKGREAGAFFMYFRPAATGVVVALDALRPLFVSEQTMLEQMPQELRNDKEAVAKFLENYRKQRNAATWMVTGAFGAGVMFYFMALAAAGDDELKRNTVATDNMDLWTRNLRLPASVLGIKDEDAFLQIPWGFGIGAFPALGAQFASAAAGNQKPENLTFNVLSILMDSYMPVPLSRISPLDNPVAFAMDSVTPSVLRPGVQFWGNLDGLGREVYQNNVTKYGAAFMGGANIPEAYRTAANMLTEVTNGDVNVQPNVLYFWANSYLDGPLRIAQNVYGMNQVLEGRKELEWKKDFAPVASFLGQKSRIDSREFADVEKKVKEMRSTMNMFLANNNEKALRRYIERHPNAPFIVDYYNKEINRDLRNLSEAVNQTKADRSLTPAERTQRLKDLYLLQDMTKRRMITAFQGWGLEP